MEKRKRRRSVISRRPSSEPRLQARVERVVAGEHVVERRHHDVGAALAQQPGERMHIVGRRVQRDQVGSRAVERRDGVEAALHLDDEGVVAERHMDAHLAERVGASLRRDAVEDGAGGIAGGDRLPGTRPSDAWHPRLLPCAFPSPQTMAPEQLVFDT